MMKDYKPYLQKAFRRVVHDVLSDVAEHGLTGESHYFITFRTDRADVILPDFVRAKYPEEISIILQNQFSNLLVKEDKFSVDLAFGGVQTTLIVPYTAIKVFTDPAAQFALSFEPEAGTPPAPAKQAEPEEIVDLTALRNKKK